MADLKTNYVDDVLDSSKNQLRKYQQIQNDDGTVSFVDVTEYSTTGTSFGAKDINDTNAAVNELNESLKSLGFSKVVSSSEIITVSANTQKRTVISLSNTTEEIAFCCVSKVSAYGGTDNFLTNCGISVDNANKYRAFLDLTSNVAGTYRVDYILFIK